MALLSASGNLFVWSCLHRIWPFAYLTASQLNLPELLHGMVALDRTDLDAFWAQRDTVRDGLINRWVPSNFARIEYAYHVARNQNRAQPGPAGLLAADQQQAQDFLGQVRSPYRTPFADPDRYEFGTDLTGRLPAANTGATALTDADFQRAATRIGCDVAAIRAVAEVESSQQGFTDGRPTIRYELHIFRRETNQRYDTTHPHLSRVYDRATLGGWPHSRAQQREWSLMHNAMFLLKNSGTQRSVEEAWRSASWGRFQVMGFNHAAVGFPALDDFVAAMYRSEGGHLDAFVGFIESNRLQEALRTHNWTRFATVYNGADNATTYAGRMQAAYARLTGQR